jgi:hypothetical protein
MAKQLGNSVSPVAACQCSSDKVTVARGHTLTEDSKSFIVWDLALN